MVRNSRHLVFLQKQIINQVKHSNTYYIIGVRMQVPIKKSRVHIWYELMCKAVSRSNKIQSRDQVISSPEVLSSRVTSTFRFLKVLDIPSCSVYSDLLLPLTILLLKSACFVMIVKVCYSPNCKFIYCY